MSARRWRRGGEGGVGKESRGRSWAGEGISKLSPGEGGGWEGGVGRELETR